MELSQYIKKSGGKIHFADFMQRALYHPHNGYYSAGHVQFGDDENRSDFLTHPEMLSPYYGRGILRQIENFWQKLGQPGKLILIELGGGNGLLMRDLLDEAFRLLPELFEALEIYMVEISSPLNLLQQKNITDHHKVRFINASALELPIKHLVYETRRWPTIIINNELFDALPYHRVKNDGNLWEIYVGHNGQEFIESQEEPHSRAIHQYFHKLGVSPAVNQHACVNLNAERLLANLSQNLEHFYLITIDYGGTTDYLLGEDLSHPRTFRHHQIGSYPYQKVGKTDITHDVDFSNLIVSGRECGLEKLYYDSEANFFQKFLKRDPDVLENYPAIFDPMFEGNFMVLIQGKKVPEEI